MDELFWASLVGATLRTAAPLLLCALAGLVSERSGVVDIGLEGKMLVAAFAAASAGAVTGALAWALLAAMGCALLMSWLHGLACVTYRGDQVVSGVALNLVAAGLTAVLGAAWFHQGGQTPALADTARLNPLISHAEISTWSGLGAVLGQAVLGHNALVYLSFLLVPGVWLLLWQTRFGLRLRAVGENPAMVEAAGLSVAALRYAALSLNGVLCGLAGAYLVLAQSASFVPHMTAGRGFMALAALIFGKWHPLGACGACLLFGFLDALAVRMQGVDVLGFGPIPVQGVQALPYVLTLVLLAGVIGRAVAPKALGQPYVKERT